MDEEARRNRTGRESGCADVAGSNLPCRSSIAANGVTAVLFIVKLARMAAWAQSASSCQVVSACIGRR